MSPFHNIPCRTLGAALCAVLILLIAVPRSAVAQAQPGTPLTLQDAVALALTRNLSLMRSANQVAHSEASVRQERADFYPDLYLTANPSLNFGQAFDQTTGQLADERTQALSVGASSSLTLFQGGAERASLAQAQREYAASQSTYDQGEQDVIFEATSRFLQIFLDQELIRVQQDNLEAQRQQLESIEMSYELGARPVADVLQQQAAIAQNEQHLLAVQRNYAISTLRLKQTLHLDPAASIALTALPEEALRPRSLDYDNDRLLQQALAANADLEAQHHRLEAAEKGIRVARAGYFPSVTLNASANTSYNSQNNIYGLSDQLLDANPNGALGLSVSLPLFNRRKTRTRVERAAVVLDDERLALETLQQHVVFNVEQALLDHQTAVLQLRAAEAQHASSREALEATEARYGLGAATFVELSQSRAVFVEAEAAHVEARYRLLMSRLTVAYHAGDIERAITDLN